MAAVPSTRARRSTGLDPGPRDACGPVGTRARSERNAPILSPVNRRLGRRERGTIAMSAYTPVCELLGVERPIVGAPLSADPGLARRGLKCRRTWHRGAGVGRRCRGRRSGDGCAERPAFCRQLRSSFDQHGRVDQALTAGLRIVSLCWVTRAAMSTRCMTPEASSCMRSAALRKRGARSALEWTSSLPMAGRPAGAYGVA